MNAYDPRVLAGIFGQSRAPVDDNQYTYQRLKFLNRDFTEPEALERIVREPDMESARVLPGEVVAILVQDTSSAANVICFTARGTSERSTPGLQQTYEQIITSLAWQSKPGSESHPPFVYNLAETGLPRLYISRPGRPIVLGATAPDARRVMACYKVYLI